MVRRGYIHIVEGKDFEDDNSLMFEEGGEWPDEPENEKTIELISVDLNKTTENDDMDKTNYKYWNVVGSKHLPVTADVNVAEKLDAGLYEIGYSQTTGYWVYKVDYENDELLDLPIDEVNEVVKDIEEFWKRKDKFIEYKYTYKRGIMLTGKQGCGKTMTIARIQKILIEEKNGIIFKIFDAGDLNFFMEFIPKYFKKIEPERQLVAIFEDIEKLVADSTSETRVLQLLDGMDSMDNIVFLATTNYPNKIKDRIMNRPSRFDRVYEIPLPTEEVRRKYFKLKLKKEDLKRLGSKGLEEWVKKTENFSIAHLKEVVISEAIFGNTIDYAIEHFEKMAKKRKPSDEDEVRTAGFKK